MGNVGRFHAYFSKGTSQRLLSKADGRDHRAECKKITQVSVYRLAGKPDIGPVIKPQVHQLEETPVSR